jgi:DNA repair photolyase
MNGKPVFTVPAKSVINFKSHFDKKLLCDGITFTAGDACAYSCSFCYVDAMQLKRQAWLKAHGVEGEHMSHVVRREGAAAMVRRQILSKPEAFRMAKKVIYSSPLVDVAANMELVRETVDICKVILELTNWDIRLLSKSNLLPKVAQAIQEWSMLEAKPTASSRIIYGVSTGTLDDKLAAAFEEGTPLVSKRIESLHWLQDNGFRTFAMVCPSLPQTDYIAFARDMASALRYDKCEHVWAEVINLRGESFTRTHDALTKAGFTDDAARVKLVSEVPWRWQGYAQDTFLAHAAYVPQGKLRFLQYTTKETERWWQDRVADGAVLL